MGIALPTRRIDAGELLQHVSRVVYRGDGTNRFDAADNSYGVLYLSLSLPTALMESVFHEQSAGTARRPVGCRHREVLVCGAAAAVGAWQRGFGTTPV